MAYTTIAALADRYLSEHVATKNKASAAAEVTRQVEKIIKPRLGSIAAAAVTFAGQTGANAFLVRDKLGHKTLAMTGRYVNRDADPLKVLSDAVDGRIMGAFDIGTGRRKSAEVVDLPTGGKRNL